MRKFYEGIIRKRKLIIFLFAAAVAVSAVCSRLVSVNYDMTDYLPKNTKSTVSLEKMQEEFDGGIPNVRVMINDVTVVKALSYKEELKAVQGVESVTWLDDAQDLTVPISSVDSDMLEAYYKDGCALFTVTVDDDYRIRAVEDIRKIIGDNGSVTGSAVSTADATVNTVKEILLITAIGVAFVLLVLILTTNSWFEPIIVLIGLGAAIMLNNGSNLIFGEISFVTNAAGSVLQLAVSLDYSVFLLHRFHECRNEIADAKSAMAEALCKSTSSILSSGLTTVIGFLALVLMQFRLGADLGLALAKGVLISLITVFVFTPSLIVCTHKLIDKTKHNPILPQFTRLGKAVRKLAFPMAIAFVIISPVSFLASNANSYLYGSSKIFAKDTLFGKDTAAIEEVFGQSDTFVLMVPKGNTAKESELSNKLEAFPQIKGIVSYVDTAGAEIPSSYLEPDTLRLLEGENYSRMVITADVPYESEETFALVKSIRDTAERYYPGDNYLVGNAVSTYDLKETITSDMVLVNLVAIGAVFIVLLISLKSLVLPFILVLSIETAIWLNLSVPYFMDKPIFYLAYLIISSVQLGATVDYAILMTDRYIENRQKLDKKQAAEETLSEVFISVITSGSVLTIVGFLIGWFSSNQLLSQLGVFIGRGAVFSLIIVLFVLPGLLYIFDGMITRKKNSKRKAAI